MSRFISVVDTLIKFPTIDGVYGSFDEMTPALQNLLKDWKEYTEDLEIKVQRLSVTLFEEGNKKNNIR